MTLNRDLLPILRRSKSYDNCLETNILYDILILNEHIGLNKTSNIMFKRASCHSSIIFPFTLLLYRTLFLSQLFWIHVMKLLLNVTKVILFERNSLITTCSKVPFIVKFNIKRYTIFISYIHYYMQYYITAYFVFFLLLDIL